MSKRIPAICTLSLLLAFPGHAIAAMPTPQRSADQSIRRELMKLEELKDININIYSNEIKRIGDERLLNRLSKEEIEGLENVAWDRYCRSISDQVDRLIHAVDDDSCDDIDVEVLESVIMSTRNFSTDESRKALRILAKNNIKYKNVTRITWKLFLFFYVPEAESLLRSVAMDHPNREERGRACHDLACFLRWQLDQIIAIRKKSSIIDEDYSDAWRRPLIETLVRDKSPESIAREVDHLLEICIKDYASVAVIGGYFKGKLIGEVAQGEQAELSNLQVGKRAPEIVGNDSNGQQFKLSEYSGRTIVLIFSGNHCGPCRSIYPQLRAMRDKYTPEKLALLSVNTDYEKKTLRESISKGEISWRCWWDGGPDGPISISWGVTCYPYIYIINKEGVIVYKDVRPSNLDKIVDSMMTQNTR